MDLPNDNKIQIHTILSSFSDTGMTLAHETEIPNITESELKTITNYYSIILNNTNKNEGLYGPLPIAYHTEYLVYIYTFYIKDTRVRDERIINNDYMVPANLLILFPTYAESIANQIRLKITQGIKAWKANFTEIQKISKKHINNLNTSLTYSLNKESSIQEMSETEKVSVVLSKSIELLYNVSNFRKNALKILIAGTDDLLVPLARKAFLDKNSRIIDGFSTENGVMTFKLGNVNIKVLKTDAQKPNLNKHLSNELDGVMYFGNFSTDEYSEIHSQQLGEIIKSTNQNCLVSFAISQKEQPIEIEKTRVPEYLAKAKGRIISLFDLANKNMNIGRAIIESLDKLVEITARVKID
jgi:hypothetical protein